MKVPSLQQDGQERKRSKQLYEDNLQGGLPLTKLGDKSSMGSFFDLPP